MTAVQFTHPFKVGDRIRDSSAHYPVEATVTELTVRGFKYEYDTPQSFIPRWGMSFVGGETYLDLGGFEGDYNAKRWELAIKSFDPTI